MARKAWTAFSTAFQQYPFDCAVLYLCPVHVGPANPLYLEKTGYAATMTGIPYDDLKAWRGPYPADVFAAQFEKVARGWQSGIADLGSGRAAGAPQTAATRRRRNCDSPAWRPFISSRWSTRRGTSPPATPWRTGRRPFPPSSGNACGRCAKAACKSEIALARRLFPLAQEDSRIGFEAANQYFYVPLDLAEKVINCRWLLEHL